MSDDNNNQQQQQQDKTDSAGNALRGRGGDLIGVDRGPVRGGNFEALNIGLESSPQGASSSVEGWVIMLSNLSPSATENDVRLLLSDVDPTNDVMGDNNNGDNNEGETPFILDLRMNPSAASCGCVGHAFLKVPRLEYAFLVQKLNGKSFVDDMPVRVDFTFAVPVAESAAASNEDGSSTSGIAGRQRDRDGAEEVAPVRPVRSDD